mmetsp:Transcript_26131/g.62978  ORF Transcript_26131/g.62978 Transcript_26131/m.62978 type:complete len:1120 (-) Transcript_26131:163-3522(-)
MMLTGFEKEFKGLEKHIRSKLQRVQCNSHQLTSLLLSVQTPEEAKKAFNASFMHHKWRTSHIVAVAYAMIENGMRCPKNVPLQSLLKMISKNKKEQMQAIKSLGPLAVDTNNTRRDVKQEDVLLLNYLITVAGIDLDKIDILDHMMHCDEQLDFGVSAYRFIIKYGSPRITTAHIREIDKCYLLHDSHSSYLQRAMAQQQARRRDKLLKTAKWNLFRVMMLGGIGSGKSSLLRSMTNQSNSKDLEKTWHAGTTVECKVDLDGKSQFEKIDNPKSSQVLSAIKTTLAGGERDSLAGKIGQSEHIVVISKSDPQVQSKEALRKPKSPRFHVKNLSAPEKSTAEDERKSDTYKDLLVSKDVSLMLDDLEGNFSEPECGIICSDISGKYETLQALLSKDLQSTFFIIVFSLEEWDRNPQIREDLTNWIHLKSAVAPRLPYTIVATHADRVPKQSTRTLLEHIDAELAPTLNKPEFKLGYCRPQVDSLSYFVVDNTRSGCMFRSQDTGVISLIDTLKTSLSSFASNTRVPVSWIEMYDKLKRFQSDSSWPPILLFDEFFKFSTVNGLKSKKIVRRMLMKFHDLGLVIYFPNAESSQEVIVVDPKMFFECVGILLECIGSDGKESPAGSLLKSQDKDSWQELNQDGKFDIKILNPLWNSTLITPPEVRNRMIHFLENIGLIAPYSQPMGEEKYTVYIAPSTLPHGLTEIKDWKGGGLGKRGIILDFDRPVPQVFFDSFLSRIFWELTRRYKGAKIDHGPLTRSRAKLIYLDLINSRQTSFTIYAPPDINACKHSVSCIKKNQITIGVEGKSFAKAVLDLIIDAIHKTTKWPFRGFNFSVRVWETKLKLWGLEHSVLIDLNELKRSIANDEKKTRVVEGSLRFVDTKFLVNWLCANGSKLPKAIRLPPKDEEQIRMSWVEGSEVRIHFSKLGWRIGRITRVYQDSEGEWLRVQTKIGVATKDCLRKSRSIRPIIPHHLFEIAEEYTRKIVNTTNPIMERKLERKARPPPPPPPTLTPSPSASPRRSTTSPRQLKLQRQLEFHSSQNLIKARHTVAHSSQPSIMILQPGEQSKPEKHREGVKQLTPEKIPTPISPPSQLQRQWSYTSSITKASIVNLKSKLKRQNTS